MFRFMLVKMVLNYSPGQNISFESRIKSVSVSGEKGAVQLTHWGVSHLQFLFVFGFFGLKIGMDGSFGC